MKNKIIENANYLVRGITTIIIGILLILNGNRIYLNLLNFLIVLVVINTLFEIVKMFSKKQKKNQKIISLSSIILGITYILLMFLNPTIPLAILPIIFAVYVSLSGIVKFINSLVLIKAGSNLYIKEMIISAVFIIVGVSCITSPIVNLKNVLMFIGLYLILLGINDVIDYKEQKIPKKYVNMLKRRIRITMPAFIEFLAPAKMLTKINSNLEGHARSEIFSKEQLKEDEEPDLEIFIHVTPNGLGKVGHMDIYFEGEVLAYGNYDKESFSLFALVGDGILFITPRERYIEFCNKYVNKTLFAFGFRLTETQKEKVREKINEIKSKTYKWNPPIKEESLKHRFINSDDYTDYASNLYKYAEVDFFKFKEGIFKKYFVLGTNCVLLADKIVGASGIDVLKVSGFITPGTYFSYLEREYKKKGTMIISKKIYKK